jgi:outer membrane immunogenic protein
MGARRDYDFVTQDGYGTNVNPLGITDRTKIDSVSSVIGRFGYAWPRVMIYGKGGGAWSHVEYSTYIAGAGGTIGTASETRSGWTAGFGAEYSFAPRFTGFIDYSWIDFGTRAVGLSAGPPLAVNTRLTESVAKTGVSYKFW